MIPKRAPETAQDLPGYLAAFTNFEIERPLPAERRALGPGRARHLLERLDLRAGGTPVIQVAGSKGKGSTVYWMEALLLQRAAKPGAYLSPHLERLNERIRIGGRDASDDQLLGGLREIHPHLLAIEQRQPHLRPTFFDLWTVLALLLFRNARCTHWLLEVGLGGPLDSTSAIEHDAGVLTTVDLEHRDLLGDTEHDIAVEKAKIATRGRPFIIQESGEAWCAAARAEAARRGARPLPPEQGIDASLLGGLPLPQRANLATAVAALQSLPGTLPFTAGQIRAAIIDVELPARLELLPGPPPILIDSAHTPKSFAHFARHFAAPRSAGPAVILLAFLEGKEWEEAILRALPWTAGVEWIVTRAPSPRALEAGRVAAFLESMGAAVQVEEETARALRLLRARGEQGSALAVSGSFYLAGAARRFWQI